MILESGARSRWYSAIRAVDARLRLHVWDNRKGWVRAMGPGAAALSVLDAISLPPLNVAQVLAGRSSLAYRHVRWVQVMHWPSSEFIRPGDLVLSTAVAPSSAAARQFLEKVVHSDAAALIVSLPASVAAEDVLSPVVELAHEADFPLLSLPWEVPFADVSRIVLGRLLRATCHVDDAVCGLAYAGVRVQGREADMGEELSRAMALRAEAAPVEVALGHAGPGEVGRNDYRRVIQELESIADQQRLKLRVCQRPEVCLLVLEDNRASVTLRDLVDRARQRAGDASTHWVVADQGIPEGREPTSDQAQSVRMAREIMREGEDWVASQSLESLFVLGAMAQSPLISRVVADAVGALIEYDRKNRRNLLETLQVFLDESCNTSAAARRLFLNRHSLIYRIKRIEELTGMSLKEPADRFFLQACVRLYRYRLVEGRPVG